MLVAGIVADRVRVSAAFAGGGLVILAGILLGILSDVVLRRCTVDTPIRGHEG